jgi:hypothetical protein
MLAQRLCNQRPRRRKRPKNTKSEPYQLNPVLLAALEKQVQTQRQAVADAQAQLAVTCQQEQERQDRLKELERRYSAPSVSGTPQQSSGPGTSALPDPTTPPQSLGTSAASSPKTAGEDRSAADRTAGRVHAFAGAAGAFRARERDQSLSGRGGIPPGCRLRYARERGVLIEMGYEIHTKPHNN